MAETQKYDPSKVFVGARLFKDTDEAGSPIVDENTGEWKSGKVLIELFDTKDGFSIAGKEVKVTRNKYLVFREDFDSLSKEDVLKEFFSDVELKEATTTPLQDEAKKSADETAAREKDARIAELEAELARRDEIDGEAFDNVRPVGDPDETPSNPEQALDASEAKEIADAGKEVVNPEQSAPNVPEDEFDTTGGNTDVASKTTEVKRDVKPVGADAKTNKAVAKAK